MTPVSAERRARVQRAVDAWVKQLIDLTGNNQLLYYRSLKVGTLELTHAVPTARRRLLGDAKVTVGELFPATNAEPDQTDQALKRARTIHNRALAIFEEKGIDTLFLALGMATWTSTTSSSTPAAPVLLRPVSLEPRGAAAAEFDLRLEGDWQVNETLLHLLASDFRVRVDVDDLQARAEGLDGSDTAAVGALMDHVAGCAATVPDFAVTDRTVIGTFAYTKLPMVKDLQASVDALAAHDLIAAIAGDDEARQAVIDARATDVSPTQPDYTPPQDEYLILDADSSQSFAINAAMAGEPLIVQGPPGTGKSQTIANLIATSAARGRRVLFVAEKRAAIEAVTKRLRAKGLEGLVMDLHGGLGSKKQFAAALGAAIAEIEAVAPVNRGDLEHRLARSRQALLDHTQALHEPRTPWGLSVYQLDTNLIGLRDRITTDLRFTTSQVEAIDEDLARRLRDELVEWANLAEPLNSGRSPWTGATVETSEGAEAALHLVDDLAQHVVPEARQSLDAVLAETGLPAPTTIEGWQDTLGLLGAVSETLAAARLEVYEIAPEVVSDLRAGRRGTIGRGAAQLFRGRYRRAKKQLRSVWVGDGKPNGRALVELADDAVVQAAGWQTLGGSGSPKLPTELETASERYGTLHERLAALGAFLVSRDLTQRRHDGVAEDVGALLSDQSTLFRLPRIAELERSLSQHHLRPLLDQVRTGMVATDDVGAVFDLMWWTAIRTTVVARDPRLANFDGSLLSKTVEAFRAADSEHVETTASRVRRAAAEHAVAALNKHRDQDRLVRAEANKKSRHIPTRKLFEGSADVLTALRPCWTMSPLVVSQLLPARQLFDLVIFDEASQVLPADAVPALLRAPQAVVAGDHHQLPPTTFFAGGDGVDGDGANDDGDDIGGAVVGFESILKVLDTTLRTTWLTWHYRSEDERLIAFANHKIYKRVMTTFPRVSDEICLKHSLVQQPLGVKVETASNPTEVERVVDLIIDHARSRPHESLGVIAMGVAHANRIQAALQARLADPALADVMRFLDEPREERMFVKNIERVQGDERSAIILSIGYAKAADGRLLYSVFGPLNQRDGYRRVNVAVTRAQRRVTVVSSFGHGEMKASGYAETEDDQPHGVDLVRQYLKYAASGGEDLEGGGDQPILNPFEVDVQRRLEEAGLAVCPQYGVSRFRIDFAIRHPSGDGFVLAVEADGARYHSTPTARDRDRLRQQVLEARGWRVHRIWSTDWFNDPQAEVAKVVAAYERAISTIEQPASVTRTSPPPIPQATTANQDGGPRRKGARPFISPGAPITDYGPLDLMNLARWVMSDGLLRTEAQVIDAMVAELGYKRKGKRIMEALERAARSAAQQAATEAASAGGEPSPPLDGSVG